MAFCPKCGASNPDNAVQCANCGTMFAAPAGVAYTKPAVPGKGLAIASMVCGIVSFFCFGIILGILAIVFGGVAKSKGYTGGMATTGIVLGVIGLGIYILMLATCGTAMIPFMDL